MVALAGCEKDESNNCPSVKDRFAKAIDLDSDTWNYYLKLSTNEEIQVTKVTWQTIKDNEAFTAKCGACSTIKEKVKNWEGTSFQFILSSGQIITVNESLFNQWAIGAEYTPNCK